MFDGLERVISPVDRKDGIEAELDRGDYLMTEVMLADDRCKVEAMEMIQGIGKDEDGRQVPGFERQERFHLMTVDGKPLGAIKVGQNPRSLTTKKLKAMEIRGKNADIIRTYPADMPSLSGKEAALILHFYGWGLVPGERYRRRHGRNRRELDAYGNPVSAIDRWRVVEVGSIFAKDAADDRCRFAAKANNLTVQRELLERALQLYPGHPAAQAAHGAVMAALKKRAEEAEAQAVEALAKGEEPPAQPDEEDAARDAVPPPPPEPVDEDRSRSRGRIKRR